MSSTYNIPHLEKEVKKYRNLGSAINAVAWLNGTIGKRTQT